MKNFYVEKFNWKVLTSNNDIVFFKLNSMILGLFSHDALAKEAGLSGSDAQTNLGFRSFTLAQNFSSKELVDKAFAELKSKGVVITKPPVEVFWGGYSGYAQDIEGNVWEFAYNPFLELDADGGVITHKSLEG